MNGPMVYIYARVSSDEQARTGFSLQTQRASCHRYVGAHSWHIGKEYQAIMTATRDDRRGYQQMLSDDRRAGQRGQEVVMVVAALDRLGRRLIERVRFAVPVRSH
jgi:DNA invertase Pin-like site-specific DNA recombinase